MSRFPFPIPHGWFGLCRSHELAAGEILKVRFCGRDLAVFRSESGTAAALDNYCPHLGAPLHQGSVQGENLRCPFHHWQWSSSGECKHIPYAKKIPVRAVIEAIPVVEKNGMVMAWHHPQGRAPYFEVQHIPALNEERDQWGEVHYYEYDLPTCIQEIAENDVDGPHFTYLHGMPALHETEANIDGPIKRSVSTMETNPDFLQGEATSIAYELIRESHGCGSVTVLSTGIQGSTPGVVGQFLLYNIATPVDEERTLLRWTMCVSSNLVDDDMGKTLLWGYPEGVKADIPIWRDKVYRDDPVLCDGDGPIARNRKWFQQFYS